MSFILAAALLGLQNAPEPPLPILRGSGLFVYDAHSGERYPAVSVPYRPGDVCYEWVIWVEPEDRTLTVREVFQLPAPAQTWGEDPTDLTAVNADRTMAMTEFSDDLGDTQISHRWCVAEGDPVGTYRIRVFAGDRLIEEFRFDVVAEPET